MNVEFQIDDFNVAIEQDGYNADLGSVCVSQPNVSICKQADLNVAMDAGVCSQFGNVLNVFTAQPGPPGVGLQEIYCGTDPAVAWNYLLFEDVVIDGQTVAQMKVNC